MTKAEAMNQAKIKIDKRADARSISDKFGMQKNSTNLFDLYKSNFNSKSNSK